MRDIFVALAACWAASFVGTLDLVQISIEWEVLHAELGNLACYVSCELRIADCLEELDGGGGVVDAFRSLSSCGLTLIVCPFLLQLVVMPSFYRRWVTAEGFPEVRRQQIGLRREVTCHFFGFPICFLISCYADVACCPSKH